MADPIGESLHAIAAGSSIAVLWVFCAGMLTSIGPCAAPRLLGVAALVGTQGTGRVYATVGLFIGGLIVAYASFGLFSSLLMHVAAFTPWTYRIVALSFATCAMWTLLKSQASCCDGAGADSRSAGAVFFLGASFALVVSPCCAPIVIAILAFSAQSGNVGFGTLLLGAFALGHAAPLVVAGAAARPLSTLTLRYSLDRAVQTIAGSIMLFLSAYYLWIA